MKKVKFVVKCYNDQVIQSIIACRTHAVRRVEYPTAGLAIGTWHPGLRSIMPGDGDDPFSTSGTPDDAQGGGPDVKPVRRFTWRELSKLNEPHNAHVAVRGKVGNKF
jgi:hypothetical protein